MRVETVTVKDLIDRTGWDSGPWDAEPDRVTWIEPETGLDCMVIRNRHGAWCGYVGVPPGHPWHGRSYGDVESSVDVHGGLTYANECWGHICHEPGTGRPADVWWFGFNCHHFSDRAPGMDAQMRQLADDVPGLPRLDDFPGTSYKTIDYAEYETISLARQLKTVADSPG